MPAVDTRDSIAILALLVATVTPLTTWVVARLRANHEARQAREAREQQRREALYVDLMEYSHTLGDWVERRHPIVGYANDPAPPVTPAEAERRRLRARADVLGSPAVRDRLQVLGTCVREFSFVAEELDDEHRSRRPGLWGDLDTKRQAVRAAIAALGDQCARELSPGAGTNVGTNRGEQRRMTDPK